MKLKLFIQSLIFLCFASLLLAQSDYRITQEFKSRHRSFEIAIEYAKTAEELNKIKKEINEFKNEFKGNKELLNRALYPANFESSFSILSKKIEYTNKKLSEISNLQTKVTNLEIDYEKVSGELAKLTREVNILRNSNSKLMAELKAFKSGYGGSKESIDSLNNLVNELRKGISKRDTLIKEIMDNIFMTAEHRIESLDDAEKQSIRTQIQGTSLIDNIRNLIFDNIEFLDASLFTPEDLSLLREEFNDFEQRWIHFGPKLFDIYSTDPQNQNKLTEIDSLISTWNNSLNKSVWKAIKVVFTSHNINLDDFETGETFESAVSKYINNQIQNSDSIGEVQSEQNYIFFAEKAWNNEFKNSWEPILLNDQLLSVEQIANIDNKVLEWKDSSTGSKSYFIYAVIVILALIIVTSIIIINRKNKKTKEFTEITESLDKTNIEQKDSVITEEDQFIDDQKDD